MPYENFAVLLQIKGKLDSRSKSRSRRSKSHRSKKSRRLRGSSIWPRSRGTDRDDRRDSGSSRSIKTNSGVESPQREDMKVVHVQSTRGSGCRMVAYVVAFMCLISAAIYAAHNYFEGFEIPYLQQKLFRG